MSNTNDEKKRAEIRRRSEQAQLPDWLLQVWVNVANRGALSIPVTLTIGGHLVSGQLIGGKEYFELLAESVESAFPLEDRPHFTNLFEEIEELGTIYDEAHDTSSDEHAPDLFSDEREREPPYYVHLKDALFFVGNSSPTSDPVLWRGRIAAVDGFCLGRLAQD